jgi:hypothetical protein
MNGFRTHTHFRLRVLTPDYQGFAHPSNYVFKHVAGVL